MKIILQPLEKVDVTIIDLLRDRLISLFGCPVLVASTESIPQTAFNTDRDQYFSDIVLQSMKNPEKTDGEIILGICDVDLYTNDMNFIFGQADISSRKAVISLRRLRYNADGDVFMDRMVKEAVHELGHLLGLDHCKNSTCVMHFSNSLQDTDNKAGTFCIKCRPSLLK